MASITVPFGEFMPSAPDFQNPGCVVADNVIPSPGGYAPFPQLTGQSETVVGTVKGAQQFFRNTGDSVIVGGTDDRLFIRTTSITQTTGYSSIGSEEAWDFCRFNDFVIATAVNNDPQYLDDIDSDTSWSALPGSPPQAKRCARVGDFVMLGNIGGEVNKIQWSSFNSPTGSWSADRLTQAGSAYMPSQFGAVQKIIGGRYALIFQKRGVMRLSYVGPPSVWRADVVSEDRGATAAFSVVPVGYQTFFLAQDGFYVTNGSAFQPIGSDRVNEWFFENIDQASISTVQGAVDWQNSSVVWAFQSSAGGSDVYDRLIIYSWTQQRWSTATVDANWVVGSQIDPTTLEDLDAIYGDLDSIPESLDSESFKGGDRLLSAFTVDGANAEYSTFTGSPSRATWETGEFQPSPGQRVFVSEVHALIEAETWDMEAAVIARNNMGVETTSTQVAAGWSGFCPVRAEGQKCRVKLVKPAGSTWSRAQGVQATFEPAGMR